MCALATVMAVSTSSLSGQAQSPARNLIQEVSTEGCIRLWRPQPVDPTKAASDRQPGLATIYLLTPPGVNSSSATDNPTYLLTPSGTIDFSKHVGQRVAITGTAQTVRCRRPFRSLCPRRPCDRKTEPAPTACRA
jgi:hypothetical protein